jgi:hypothetical protein
MELQIASAACEKTDAHFSRFDRGKKACMASGDLGVRQCEAWIELFWKSA